MAVYRFIQVGFWQDAFVLDLTPEEKYFYIYLMTNSKTSQCGIYELPLRVIEMDTGYNRETVEKLIKRFTEYGKILYSTDTKEIMVLNWMKFNYVNNSKVKSCMRKELLEVKNKEFIKKLVDILKEQNITEDIEWIPYTNPIDTIEMSKESTKDTISIPNIYPIDNTSIEYGEKEKEKEKQKQKEKENKKEKQKEKEKEKEKEKQVQRIKQEVEIKELESKEEEEEEEETLINKENYKAINKATVKQEQTQIESQSVSILNYFENLTGLIGGLNLSALKTAVKDHGEDNVKKAIDKALEKNKPTMIYINGILNNWAVEGYPSEKEGLRNGSFNIFKRNGEGKYSGFKPQEPRTLTEEERREIEAELL